MLACGWKITGNFVLLARLSEKERYSTKASGRAISVKRNVGVERRMGISAPPTRIFDGSLEVNSTAGGLSEACLDFARPDRVSSSIRTRRPTSNGVVIFTTICYRMLRQEDRTPRIERRQGRTEQLHASLAPRVFALT